MTCFEKRAELIPWTLEVLKRKLYFKWMVQLFSIDNLSSGRDDIIIIACACGWPQTKSFWLWISASSHIPPPQKNTNAWWIKESEISTGFNLSANDYLFFHPAEKSLTSPVICGGEIEGSQRREQTRNLWIKQLKKKEKAFEVSYCTLMAAFVSEITCSYLKTKIQIVKRQFVFEGTTLLNFEATTFRLFHLFGFPTFFFFFFLRGRG